MITGRVQLCLGPSWREVLRLTITKKCPATHHVSVHAGGTVLWKEHGKPFTSSTYKLFFVCGHFACLCYIRVAIHGCLCCKTILWLPCSPPCCYTHSWSWKIGSLMGSPICHSWYPLIGSEHGVTDLLSEFGNIVWGQVKGFHQDLDYAFSWKSEIGGSERGKKICEWCRIAREDIAEGSVQTKEQDRNKGKCPLSHTNSGVATPSCPRCTKQKPKPGFSHPQTQQKS